MAAEGDINVDPAVILSGEELYGLVAPLRNQLTMLIDGPLGPRDYGAGARARRLQPS